LEIERPRRGTGDPTEAERTVALANPRDDRVDLAVAQTGVAAEIGERGIELRDPPADSGDAEILCEPGNRG